MTRQINKLKEADGFYKFEADGYDSGTEAHDGTQVGSISIVAGKSGNCAHFDGSTGYYNLGNDIRLDGATSFSINFWIKPDALPFVGSQGVYARGSVSNRSPWIYGTNNNSRISMLFDTVTGGSADGNKAIPGITQDEWQMITFTWDGTNVRGYRNGAESSTTDITVGSTLVDTDGSNYIGKVTTNPALVGSLDELRIYKDYVLSEDEIAYLYNNPSGQTQWTDASGVSTSYTERTKPTTSWE